MNETQPVRILLIEDELVTARLLKERLEKAGYAVDFVRDSEEGIAKAISEKYDILAVDYSLPGANGLEVIRILGSKGIFPPIVMVTGKGDERIAVEAMKLGAKDYIVKDEDGRYLGLLPRVIERILSEKNLLEEKAVGCKSPERDASALPGPVRKHADRAVPDRPRRPVHRRQPGPPPDARGRRPGNAPEDERPGLLRGPRGQEPLEGPGGTEGHAQQS